MLIIGEQEMLEESVSLRKHGGEDLGKMKVEDFINYFKQELTINQ
jgi:threonyl-tRNA synthetase